jgi:ferric-dicitrate binding protein FerR (iron transport regulator)
MRMFWRLSRLGVPVAFLFAATGALAETQIGHVIQKEFNGATGVKPSAASADELVYTREVVAGEKVTTPAGGSTVMRFHDQTQLQIGANSTVVLDRFVYDPGSQADSGSITLAKGLFRYIGGQGKDTGVQLSTPTTTLTIRGTKFLAYVKDDGTTTVAVIEGAVDVKPCGNGDVAHANAGQAYQVTHSCAVGPVPTSSIPSDPAITSDATVDNGGNGVGLGSNGNDSAPGGPSPGGSPKAGHGFNGGNGKGTP